MLGRSYQIGTMPLLGKSNKTAVRLTEKSKVSLDVRISDGQGNNNTLSLPSFVEKVHHDSSFLIKMPLYQDNFYSLPQDEMCMMYFTAELEDSRTHGVFAMPVCFAGKVEQGDHVYARMESLGEIERSQRRDCYRLPLSISVSLKRGDKNTPLANARMLDISDGGMLFATGENFGVNETLILDFNISGHETVEGIVVRSEPAEYVKREFRVAVKFKGADKKQKQRFYRFIVEKQLERKQRQSWAA